MPRFHAWFSLYTINISDTKLEEFNRGTAWKMLVQTTASITFWKAPQKAYFYKVWCLLLLQGMWNQWKHSFYFLAFFCCCLFLCVNHWVLFFCLVSCALLVVSRASWLQHRHDNTMPAHGAWPCLRQVTGLLFPRQGKKKLAFNASYVFR